MLANGKDKSGQKDQKCAKVRDKSSHEKLIEWCEKITLVVKDINVNDAPRNVLYLGLANYILHRPREKCSLKYCSYSITFPGLLAH